MRELWQKKLTKVDDKVSSREWALRVGKPITQAVVDDKRVYVGIPNSHLVVALDSTSGKELWSYTAEGRISAPPTLYKGLCIFSDHAGFVHCVHSGNGSLRRRLRAARSEELIMAYGQLESPWPVRGGVIVDNDIATFLSGRAVERTEA